MRRVETHQNVRRRSALTGAITVFAALGLTERPAAAEDFDAGSIIIPMDLDYQDDGMFRASSPPPTRSSWGASRRSAAASPHIHSRPVTATSKVASPCSRPRARLKEPKTFG